MTVSAHVILLIAVVLLLVAAQAGAASTITLAAGASATNDFYRGFVIVTTGGTGSGQTRLIRSYVGSTKVATVTPDWTTQPDATTTYAVKAGHRYRQTSTSIPTARPSTSTCTATTAATASCASMSARPAPDRMHLAAKLRQAKRHLDEAEANLERATKIYGRAAYFHDSVMKIVRDMGEEPQK